MRGKPRVLMILMAVLLLAAALLPAADQVAAWDSDKLDQPIAVDGRIRHQENSSYSFELNSAGIPEEPVIFRAKLSDSIDSETGTATLKDAEQLFDPEKLMFVTNGFTSYIGAKVTAISPGKTTYTSNGNVYEGEGSNVDIIKGATAQLSLQYNPEFTHQKGAIWYCISDQNFGDYAALPGGSVCTVFGNETTDLTGEYDSSNSLPKVMRAVSIYDPWFDAMEEEYGDQAREEYRDAHPEASDKEVAAVTWKSMYLSKSVEDHLKSNSIWRYPYESEVTVYTDYQITVRSPIEMVTFTSKAEYAIGSTESDYQAPQYLLFNDQVAHPDMTATNKIWCYDTSDSSGASQTVDAFRIESKIDPDYGYNLEFEIVKGSSIGHLDFTELDGNTFRFVPKGAYQDPLTNEWKTNYGSVVIKATAQEVGFTKYFTLMYVPSNMKIVKYIPDKENWDAGVQVDPATGLVVEYDEKTGKGSGEWDVVTYRDSTTGKDVTQLYGMECLVLYPEEKFELAMVQYVDNKDGRGKQPYYMTEGVRSYDYSSPIYAEYDGQIVNGQEYEEGDLIGYEERIIKYAVSYSVTRSDDPDSEPEPGILEFAHYGEVVKGWDDTVDGVTDVLQKANHDTGQSYWYTTDNHTVVGLKEGTYYLRYTVAPINEDGGISMAESTLTGGIYLYIVSPANQALGSVITQQNPQGTRSLITAEIPYRISAGQRTGVIDRNGDPMPSHWYLGESRGAVRYPVIENDSGDFSIYYGSAYAMFTDAGFMASETDRSNLQLNDIGGKQLVGIESIDFGERYLSIFEDSGKLQGVPEVPDKATNDWKGTLAISEATNEAYKGGPSITDIRVTGPYGLARFPGVHNLRIVDTAPNASSVGEFTEANITINSIGQRVWDFSSLTIRNYQHANMGSSGKNLEVFYAPASIQVLNLDSAEVVTECNREQGSNLSIVPNCLNCQFAWGNAKDTLKELWVGGNLFTSLEINGFSKLQAVLASGSKALEGSETPSGVDKGRILMVYNCPELEYVEADDTAFNYVMADFPRTISNENLKGSDSTESILTMFRANSAPNLFKVNVSGHLTYLELVGDRNLLSVISSNTFSPGDPDHFTMSSEYSGSGSIPSDAGWVRVVNLGSYFLSKIGNVDPHYRGTTSALPPDASESFIYRNDRAKISADYTASNPETMKFNFLYRLYSGSVERSSKPNDLFNQNESHPDKGRLKELIVFCLVADPDVKTNYTTVSMGGESHLSSANTTQYNIYSFDYRHGGNIDTSVLFYHVPKYASINFSDANMKSVTILNFDGFLNLYGAKNLDDLHVNENRAGNVGDSAIEMSRSGVINFTGTESFKGFQLTPMELSIMLEYAGLDDAGKPVFSKVYDRIRITGRPSSYNSGLSVASVRALDPSVCTVSWGRADDGNGLILEVLGQKAGQTEIVVTVKESSSGRSETFNIPITVFNEPISLITLLLTGGKTETRPDGTEVIVVEYNTRNDSPIALELKAYENELDISVDFFYESEDIYEENGISTYEDGFKYLQSQNIPTVTWTFESTGHSGQEYAEIILDSYSGHRVYIDPLIDDQEFYGTVEYHDLEQSIDYTAQFIVRVTGGASDRWSLEITPSSNNMIPLKEGVRSAITATLYDKQLLTNGQPTTVPESEYETSITWSIPSGSSIFSYSVDSSMGLGRRIYVTPNDIGEGTIKASYRNGVVTATRTLAAGVALPDSLMKALATTAPFRNNQTFLSGVFLPSMASGVTTLDLSGYTSGSIEISNGSICYLNSDNFPSLTTLNINGCSISSSNLYLKGCDRLTTIYAEDSNITTVNDANLPSTVRYLYLSDSSLSSLTLTSSRIQRVEADGCNLSSVSISTSCTGLTYLDVSDNNLGGGSMKIGDMSYSSHSFSGGIEYWGLRNLSTFIAYGNKISFTLTASYNTKQSSYMKLGSSISGKTAMDKHCSVSKGFWDWGSGRFGCGCWVEDKNGNAIVKWEGEQTSGTWDNSYSFSSGAEGIYRFRAYSRKDAGDSSHKNQLTCYPYGK